MSMADPVRSFELIDASIADVLEALRSGDITSVWLIGCHLDRIEAFDRGAGGLNSIPVLNPNALVEAAESDRRWRAGIPRALEGVPYTVKDSYSVEGLTVAAGSPAFEHVVARHDAFCVEKLRGAGAVLIGKSNMPPMADGGMQRGLYGRPESPYNRDFLAAAYASGSSSGSGVATTANPCRVRYGRGDRVVRPQSRIEQRTVRLHPLVGSDFHPRHLVVAPRTRCRRAPHPLDARHAPASRRVGQGRPADPR